MRIVNKIIIQISDVLHKLIFTLLKVNKIQREYDLIVFCFKIQCLAILPYTAQLEKLVELMESKPWIATGHARAAHAIERSHYAWMKIQQLE
ncbi:unnamed protein product [Leptidea sinapis]|uniref:Uncharacterized protein n=1 Tax=Leptidea sinapis TaxID=189913 RepID=A0A5E4R461_9NEOP|nr:unnamed protein product [Leptidea sinapis]